MKLKDIANGNLFKYFPNIGRSGELAFKSSEVIRQNVSVIIPINKLYKINNSMVICPICKVDEYSSSKFYSDENLKIKEIDEQIRKIGVVGWTNNPLGLTQIIITMKNLNDYQTLVADTKSPVIIDNDINVIDLGLVGEYTEPISNIIQKCPNCNQDTLISSEEVLSEEESIFICQTCGIKVILSWS